MLTINNRKKNPYLITEDVRIQKFNSFCYIGCSNFQITFRIKDYRLVIKGSYFFLRPKKEVEDLASLALNIVVFSPNTDNEFRVYKYICEYEDTHSLGTIREVLTQNIN